MFMQIALRANDSELVTYKIFAFVYPILCSSYLDRYVRIKE